MLVSVIIDSSRGLIIDSVLAVDEEEAIKKLLTKHSLFDYQINQLCITNVQR